MADIKKALRNLQIFRNNDLIEGTASIVKGYIETAITNGTIELHDGEPISVRYHERGSNDVKGLFGVMYAKNGVRKVLWDGNGAEINIETIPTSDDYVTLNYSLDTTTNTYTFTVEASTANLDDSQIGTALAKAADVKRHIKYYNIVPLDDIVNVTVSTNTDANGFETTTFKLSISTENLPSAPKYTIGTTQQSNAYHNTYVLREDGSDVTNSTIEVDKYSGGNGIAISTMNVVSAKISSTGGNQLIFKEDGGLFVPAGETIVDVSSVTAPGDDSISVYYGYIEGEGYVVLTPVYSGGEIVGFTYGNGINYNIDNGVGGPVYGGHKYIVVRTSGGNIYLANSDAANDIHVQSFTIGTDSNNEPALVITMNENNNTHTVAIGSIIDFVPKTEEATVNWDQANDTMLIGTSGILTQLALGTIEKYIDNFDCGTF